MVTIALAGKFKIFNVTLQRSPLTLLHRFEPCRPLFDASNPFSLNLYARGVTSEGNASLATGSPPWLSADPPSEWTLMSVTQSLRPPSVCLSHLQVFFLTLASHCSYVVICAIV